MIPPPAHPHLVHQQLYMPDMGRRGGGGMIPSSLHLPEANQQLSIPDLSALRVDTQVWG